MLYALLTYNIFQYTFYIFFNIKLVKHQPFFIFVKTEINKTLNPDQMALTLKKRQLTNGENKNVKNDYYLPQKTSRVFREACANI